MPYQPGIPTGTVPLNQDYLNIQGNFTSLNSQFNVDHVPLTNTSGSPPNGYHTSIHLVPQVSITNVAGYGQWYSQTINDGNATDQALFFNTGTGNRTSQFTRNYLPIAATNGCSFIPGPAGVASNQGAIMDQWGMVSTNFPTNTGTVTFPKVFPNNLFNVQITMIGNSGTANLVQFVSNIPHVPSGVQGFNWRFTGGSSTSFTGFFWRALGN